MPDFSNTLYSVNLFSFFFNCQLRLLEPKYFNIEEMCSPPVFFFKKDIPCPQPHGVLYIRCYELWVTLGLSSPYQSIL